MTSESGDKMGQNWGKKELLVFRGTMQTGPLVFLLCAAQVVYGAPTFGDELAGNIQQNMGAIHGNLMAGITNFLKPMADLIDKVPNAIFGGRRSGDGMLDFMQPSKDGISDAILGGVGAFNSGLKLGSTLVAAPLKLAGDGMMALENMVLGRDVDYPTRTQKDSGQDIIDRALEVVQKMLPTQGRSINTSFSMQKRQARAKFLQGVTEMLDRFNDRIAENVNEEGDLLVFLGDLFSLAS